MTGSDIRIAVPSNMSFHAFEAARTATLTLHLVFHLPLN